MLENGSRGWRRLRLACEAVKRELTYAQSANIDLDDLCQNQARRQSDCGLLGVGTKNFAAAPNLALPGQLWAAIDSCTSYELMRFCTFARDACTSPGTWREAPLCVSLCSGALQWRAPWRICMILHIRCQYEVWPSNLEAGLIPHFLAAIPSALAWHNWFRHHFCCCRTCFWRFRGSPSSTKWSRCWSAAWTLSQMWWRRQGCTR